ncbi:MAG: copper homeostasis protein CutC [Alphaproteobacteria bacterium]|jgi:copper homeostasis protein|nr:copper homeostasis protein CutC [Alphaproteobacteria bacterium]
MSEVPYIIESCCENFSESLIAQSNGATRIELCENLAVGGITPSYGNIKLSVDKLSIPTFVMIRPRGGNFVYNENEVNIMLHDINVCKSLSVSGVVFGTLHADNTIDYKLMDMLCKASTGLEIVMHRAIDEVKDSWNEIGKLKKLGVKHLLSSGGAKTALEGVDNLHKIYEACKSNNMKLTAAGKITKANLTEISSTIPADAYHGRQVVDYTE